MKDYIVIASDSFNFFLCEVNKAIKDGYLPCPGFSSSGGFDESGDCVGGNVWSQAMIKESVDDIPGDEGEKLKNIHPGRFLLEEFLRPRGMSEFQLSSYTGIELNKLYGIIHGGEPIDKDVDRRLCRMFSSSDGFWFCLQKDYDKENS